MSEAASAAASPFQRANPVEVRIEPVYARFGLTPVGAEAMQPIGHLAPGRTPARASRTDWLFPRRYASGEGAQQGQKRDAEHNVSCRVHRRLPARGHERAGERRSDREGDELGRRPSDGMVAAIDG